MLNKTRAVMARYTCKCGKDFYIDENNSTVYHDRPTCAAFERRIRELKGEFKGTVGVKIEEIPEG